MRGVASNAWILVSNPAGVEQVLTWLEVRNTDSPLPPLRGRLEARRLEIAGAQMHGVVVEFEDEPSPADIQ